MKERERDRERESFSRCRPSNIDDNLTTGACYVHTSLDERRQLDMDRWYLQKSLEEWCGRHLRMIIERVTEFTNLESLFLVRV